jgi:GGDEF domain-containing protein
MIGSGNGDYRLARRAMFAAGLVVLALIASIAYLRRVETIEVISTLLFIPVFMAFFVGGARTGLVAGLISAAAYAALRFPAVEVLGSERFIWLIWSRAAAFVAFGVLGGWATSQLQASLTKLELYDQIDDETRLYNARFFVEDTDAEIARSRRYQSIFSVAAVDVPHSAFEGLSRRQKEDLLRDLGRLLSGSIRSVDRAVHAVDDQRHRFAAILPETGAEGAQKFTDQMAKRLLGQLGRPGGLTDAVHLDTATFTFPGDDGAIAALRHEFAAIAHRQYPEAPVPGNGVGLRSGVEGGVGLRSGVEGR